MMRFLSAGFLWLLVGGLALAQNAAPGAIPVTGVPVRELAALDRAMLDYMEREGAFGAAVGVTYRGRLVYARGFGWASPEARAPVDATALFRIASVSKPLTGVAVLHLAQSGHLRLDEPFLAVLRESPTYANMPVADARMEKVTIRHLLNHTGGWHRNRFLDPMVGGSRRRIAEQMGAPLPVDFPTVFEFMFRQPLQLDPGHVNVYSNFGYSILGRVIEIRSGLGYEEYVQERVLAPLGISRMKLGRSLESELDGEEVHYHELRPRLAWAVIGPRVGRMAPRTYDAMHLELMDAHGGWIASTVDLLRFAVAFDSRRDSPVLDATHVALLLARPPGLAGYTEDGRPRDYYYACGLEVRPTATGSGSNLWHGGYLAGTSSMLTMLSNGVNLAVLFNSSDGKETRGLAGSAEGLLKRELAAIEHWPDHDLFTRYP